MSRAKSERRKQPRAKGIAGVTVGARPHVAGVQVKDISVAGLCFRNSRPIEFMSRLKMTLVFPARADADANPDEIQCEGAVVRCERVGSGEGSHYEIAVFFTDIDDASRKAVEKYVREHA